MESHGQDDQVSASDVLESVGIDEPVPEQLDSPSHAPGDGNSGKEADLPAGVKARLGRQEKRHQREMRALRAEMQAMVSPQSNDLQNQQPEPMGSVDDSTIQRAVRQALAAQEEQKRMMKDQESQAHVSRKYQSLQHDLDKAADKYEDFEEVVRSQDAPYTPAMRDAALFLDNPADVLYKLGKNPQELSRISQLHPVDQAREMIKLSHALMSGSGTGNERKPSTPPIGQIKSNPIHSSSINQNTPVDEIRRRMKSGDWKPR